MSFFVFSEKTGESSGPIKILDAPVHLGTLAENMHKSEDEPHKIWMAKRVDDSSVIVLTLFLAMKNVHALSYLFPSEAFLKIVLSFQMVDKKKLQKAEQKIKQKQEKRALQDSATSKPVNG